MTKLVITDDNSHTVFNENIGEHYHSTHGAIQESKHIFIEAGLKAAKVISNNINILEIGFGTGLNALLSYSESEFSGLKINYIAIEPYPIENEIYLQLNYSEVLNNQKLKNILTDIHQKPWNIPFYVSDNFILNKVNAKIQDIQLTDNVFDIVYFDAFSPQFQPELWTEDIFRKIFNSMKNNGILTTYSSKGDVKRAMKKVGFKLELLPGPAGKRHIIRAMKIIEICSCKQNSHNH